MEKLIKIQKELKAPKGLFNSFGNYKYRSCEAILEAVKPLLDGAVLTLSDDIVYLDGEYTHRDKDGSDIVKGKVYVKATATISDGATSISVSAFAREAPTKKGMDDSQITGAASSYARKYALNGLFLIDDTKDADTQDNTKADVITDKQKNTIIDMIADTNTNIDNFLKYLKIDSIDQMSKAVYKKAVLALETKKNQGAS